MKRIILTFLAFTFFQISWSQVPTKMSYQAVVRDASNALVANQNVGIKISILQGAPDGATVYEETHITTSNSNGLVSLVINEGQSISGDFSTIYWTDNTYFIKSEIDVTGGTNYSITGVQQIFSVPYAIHAKTADNFTFEDAELGEMLYFNGSDWVSIPAGLDGQVLSYCNGKPTWGLCLETIIGGPPTSTTARVNGRLNTDIGDVTITEKGICYSTTPNPNIADLTRVYTGSGTAWGIALANLTINTTYYAKAYIINSSGIQYGNEVSFTTSSSIGIGDYYPEEGGVVFYLLQPGDPGYDANTPHGLIVSLTYILPIGYQWGCEDTLIGTSTDIFSGNDNTNLIASTCDQYPIAAKLCIEYSSLGFNDWYLGSKDEMYHVAINKSTINSTLANLSETNNILNTNSIWTSSESTSENAITIRMNSSAYIFGYREKEYPYNFSTVIRPIRSF